MFAQKIIIFIEIKVMHWNILPTQMTIKMVYGKIFTVVYLSGQGFIDACKLLMFEISLALNMSWSY